MSVSMDDLRQLYRSDRAYEHSMRNYDETVKKWQIQPESLSVETRFGRTHVLRVGDLSKPPFMFFHGWNGNAAGAYEELDIVRLSRYFCLHFPDTIGQSGKSAPVRPPTDDASYGQWGADIITSLKLNQLYLCGLSGGGYLALKTASNMPEAIEKLFLMVPGGFVDLSRINLRFISSVLPAALGFKWGGRFFVRRMLSPDYNDNARIRQMGDGMRDILGNLKPVNGPKPLTDEELSQIQCPVYVVAGTHDIAINPERTVQRAEQTLQNVKTQTVHAGHMITLEKLAWLMDEMLKFFDVE